MRQPVAIPAIIGTALVVAEDVASAIAYVRFRTACSTFNGATGLLGCKRVLDLPDPLFWNMSAVTPPAGLARFRRPECGYPKADRRVERETRIGVVRKDRSGLEKLKISSLLAAHHCRFSSDQLM